MIKIKPLNLAEEPCPSCNGEIVYSEIFWQGIHVCVKGLCSRCDSVIYSDLPTGHSRFAPYKYNLTKDLLYGSQEYISWFGKPLRESLKNQIETKIKLEIDIRENKKEVEILNCLDNIYGHVLLKILNIEKILNKKLDRGVVVIIPENFNWLIPDAVSEVWKVKLSLKQIKLCYSDLNYKINKEMTRFTEAFLLNAIVDPNVNDISILTNVKKHDFSSREKFRITFIWREDRLWSIDSIYSLGMNKIKVWNPLILHQKRKVIKLFKILKRQYPKAKYTVVGMGTSLKFPKWIEDLRLNQLNEDLERKYCIVYSESRIIIGVHGSNMLLPSAHAGMTIDLMPNYKWKHITEDIIFQDVNPKVCAYKYRFIPLNISEKKLAYIVLAQLKNYSKFIDHVHFEQEN